MDYFNDKKKVVSFCQLFLCNESPKKKRPGKERNKKKPPVEIPPEASQSVEYYRFRRNS